MVLLLGTPIHLSSSNTHLTCHGEGKLCLSHDVQVGFVTDPPLLEH